MDLFKRIIEFFLIEKEKIKENINNINIELLRISDNLSQFSLEKNIVDENIENADTGKLRVILKSLNVDFINDKDLETLDDIKKIMKFLYDPQIPNVGVKKAKLTFINEFKKKMNEVNEKLNDEINRLNDNLNFYRELNNKINFYLDSMNENGFIREMSIDELNEFFDFLESSSINKNLILELISVITIGKLKKAELLSEKKFFEEISEISKIEEVVDKNSEKIIVVENEKLETEDVDLSLLNDNEIKLLGTMANLINKHNMEDLGQFNEFIKEIFSGLSIEERKEFYLVDGNLDWSVIVADYNNNLLSNINKNKDDVLAIFRFVIEMNDKINKMNTEENEKLSKVIKNFRSNSNLVNEILNNFYSNPSEFCLGLSDVDVQRVNYLIYKMGVLSKNTVEKIESNDIKSSNLEVINSQMLELMSEFKEITKRRTNKFPDGNQKGYVYKTDTTKTLILLLKDENENFVPVSEIENESKRDKSDVMMDELQKAVVMISEVGMSDNKRNFKSSHVDKGSTTGSDVLLKDYFGFDVDRIRFSERGRTGYVIVPVHENNRKKLINEYGDNIFYQNYNSIILVVGSICCSASHTEYESFKNLISTSESYVRYVLDLFKNPNANVEEMMNVIDESAKECKKLSSGYGRGGK